MSALQTSDLLSFAALRGGEVKLDPGSEAGEDSLVD
jgi:hypothetical protein